MENGVTLYIRYNSKKAYQRLLISLLVFLCVYAAVMAYLSVSQAAVTQLVVTYPVLPAG